MAKRLGPSVPDATAIEVRTLHALARQVLLDAGEGSNILADRLPAPPRRPPPACHGGSIGPAAGGFAARHVALGLEGGGSRAPGRCGGRPADLQGAAAGARRARLRRPRGPGGRPARTDPALRLRWQSRFEHVCVDEFQDVDAAQLRLVRLLAAPQDNLFVVGDDDQTIYAWRLADVRRILRFGKDYPTARRVMLATNYRCPAPVIEASARMVAVNRERFEKPIRAPNGAGHEPGAISAVSSADPRWPQTMAQLAATEDGAGRTLLLPVPHPWRADAVPSCARRRRGSAHGRRSADRRGSPRPGSCRARAAQTMAAIHSMS